MKFTFFKLFLLFTWSFAFCQTKKQKDGEYYLLIGTYTTGKSEGVYVYKFNSITGKFNYVNKVPTSNPSYLAVSPNEKYVYAVNENGDDKGSIAAFSFNKKDGSLHPLNKQASGGDHPCYVSVDRNGKWVLSGNYSGGSLAVLPVNRDGSLQPASQVIRHEGKSINRDRQEKPHVHSTVFAPDDKYVFVPDLGIDKVMIYTFDQRTGKMAPANPSLDSITAGSGPRHFTFHPNGKYAYLMEELSGNVQSYRYNGHGQLKPLQTISALPADYKGSIGSADIHVSPDGRFLYASNRGESNTLAIFSIDSNGGLKLEGHQSTLGTTPRNFSLDPTGNYLLVANQNSNNIVVFRVDKHTGRLTPLPDQILVDKPVCVKWISAE